MRSWSRLTGPALRHPAGCPRAGLHLPPFPAGRVGSSPALRAGGRSPGSGHPSNVTGTVCHGETVESTQLILLAIMLITHFMKSSGSSTLKTGVRVRKLSSKEEEGRSERGIWKGKRKYGYGENPHYYWGLF